MEIILIFVAGFIVLMIATFSLIKMVTNRVTAPANDLRAEITTLRERIDEIEKGDDNN